MGSRARIPLIVLVLLAIAGAVGAVIVAQSVASQQPSGTLDATPTLDVERLSTRQAELEPSVTALQLSEVERLIAQRVSVAGARRSESAVDFVGPSYEPFDEAIGRAAMMVIGAVVDQFLVSGKSAVDGVPGVYLVSRVALEDGSSLEVAQDVGVSVTTTGSITLFQRGCALLLSAGESYGLLVEAADRIPGVPYIIPGNAFAIRGGRLVASCPDPTMSAVTNKSPEEFENLIRTLNPAIGVAQ